MKNRHFILTALLLAACSAAPESVDQSSEALIVPLVMHVQPGTAAINPPRATLSQDAAHPTPSLVLVTLLVSTCTSQYSVSTKQAILCVTSAQFTDAKTKLATPGHTTDVDLSYDNSGALDKKTVTSFSFVLI